MVATQRRRPRRPRHFGSDEQGRPALPVPGGPSPGDLPVAAEPDRGPGFGGRGRWV
jgi:hypothetical protein